MENKFGILLFLATIFLTSLSFIIPINIIKILNLYSNYTVFAIFIMLPFLSILFLSLFVSHLQNEKKIFPILSIIIISTPLLFLIFLTPLSKNEVKNIVNIKEDGPIAGGRVDSCRGEQEDERSPYASIRAGYFKDYSKRVYFFDGNKTFLMEEVNADNFKCLPAYRGTKIGRFYGKDSNNLYFGASKISGVDLNSVEFLTWGYYIKDKNNVYANGVLLEGADSATFNFSGANTGFGYFAKDKNSVYVNQTKLFNSDPTTYQAVCEPMYGYAKDKNNVYYKEVTIKDADTKTFNCFNGEVYFADKNFIYYQGKPIKEANAETFKIISLGAKDSYAYDNLYYYKNNEIIGNTNSNNFRVIADKYLLNGDRLLWGDNNMLISNYKNLSYLAAGYLTDGNNVYSTKVNSIGIIEGLSPSDFKVYFNGLDSTNISVYFIKKGNTISVIEDYTDYYKSWVIFETIIKDADVNTFSIINWPYVKDRQSVYLIADNFGGGYYSDKVFGADPETFKFPVDGLTEHYAVDKNNVYFGLTKLEKALPNKFYLKKIDGFKYDLGVSEENVYFDSQLLNNIKPDNIVIEQNGGIIRSGNISWYLECNMYGIFYSPESELKDPKNYLVNGDCKSRLENNSK